MAQDPRDPSSFPVRGVTGVLGGSPGELARQERSLAAGNARSVEVRADLFPSTSDALAAVARLASEHAVLFTLRHRSEGGEAKGDHERVPDYREAVRRGAALVDAELRSQAARELTREGVPVLASAHDFERPIGRARLDSLAEEAREIGALGVKVVPTAQHPSEALDVLEWVAARSAGAPARVGFAMGGLGVFSRILAIAWGSPLTYGALGAAVAPGQIPAGELTHLYRAESISRRTRLFAEIGHEHEVASSLAPHMHNPALATRGIDAVYVPLALATFADLDSLRSALPIDGASAASPFATDALESAQEVDAASRLTGGADTLVFNERGACAWNTDVESEDGPEPLVSQALAQFRLFTGEDATYEELERGFLQARR